MAIIRIFYALYNERSDDCMEIRNINKTDVTNMMTNTDLYLIRVMYKDYEGRKIRNCYMKHVQTMPVNKIIEAINDENAIFVEIKEES